MTDANATAILASLDAIVREVSNIRSEIVRSIPPPPPAEPLPSSRAPAVIARVPLSPGPPPPLGPPAEAYLMPRWRVSYFGPDGPHRHCHVRAEDARDASLLGSVRLDVSRFDVEVEPVPEPDPTPSTKR